MKRGFSNKKSLSILLFFVVLFSFNFFVSKTEGAEIVKDVEVLISRDKIYEENLYVGAARAFIEGQALEDLVVFGGEISVSSNVSKDIFLTGVKLNFSGKSEGDLRMVGGDLNISGNVSGDLFVIGANVVVEDSTSVEKSTFIVADTVEIKNTSNAKLKIIARNVLINGTVLGGAEITTQNLRLGQNANISSDFYYFAPQKFAEEQGAVVSGKISFNEISSFGEMTIVQKAVFSFMSFWYLFKFISTLIIAFILIYVFKLFTQSSVDLLGQSFLKSFLAGFLILFLGPIIVSLLFVSLVGLPVGFLFLMTLIFVMILSPAISGIALGVWLKKYFNKGITREVNFQAAAIGIILLTLLQFLPILGGILRTIIWIASIGVIFRQIRLSIIK